MAKRVTIGQICRLDAPDLRVVRASAVDFETTESEVDGTTRTKYRKIETPFDQAKRHKWITDDQHKALDMLCVSFQRAGLLPRITMNWSQVLDGSREAGSSEPRERHTRRFREAMGNVPAEYRDGFLSWFIAAQSEDVSVHDLGSYFTEMRHKEARKAVGVHILQLCARIFSDHFGLSEKNTRAREKSA